MEDNLPEVTLGLLTHLNEAFPNSLPRDLSFHDRDIAAQWGARSVIDHLQSLYDEANTTEGQSHGTVHFN